MSLSAIKAPSTAPAAPLAPQPKDLEVHKAFNQFVGETLFGQMLKSMRQSVGKPAYFHGGRAEEMFQQQLDQHLVEDLSNKSASKFADPMWDLFMARRS